MKNYSVLFSCLLFLFFTSCHRKVSSFVKKQPKNVIFIIADGMGPSTVAATRVWAKGSGGRLNMEKMSYTGYAKTYSASDFVTDSAASGTALASGVKTYNRSIGLSYKKFDKKKKSRPLETIIDVMKSHGKSVGVITTARVTHATPACFFAHVEDRWMENEIASQVQNSKLDLLMGGGRRHFLPEKDAVKEELNHYGIRKDSRNIIKELKSDHWSIIQNKNEMNQFNLKSKESRLVALFSDKHMTYEATKRTRKDLNEPTLTEMVNFSLEFLSDNKKGFFLVIESGRIDHASHENNVKDMLEETLELDNCLGKLLSQGKLKNTLIVLTADHETGGYAASGYGDVLKTRGEEFLKTKKGKYGKKYNYSSWATGPGSSEGGNQSFSANKTVEANHTAVDVPILASGPGAYLFTGFIENTQIPRKIMSLFGYQYKNSANYENPEKIRPQ